MQQQEIIVLQGGVDMVTPGLAKRPGTLIGALNYESEARGYRRMQGWERFDGRPKPSEANYHILGFDAGGVAVSAGDIVTGATSGASGEALVDGVLTSGTYGGGDAAGQLVLFNVTGTFQDNENLEVSASTVAVANGIALENSAATGALHDTYLQGAIEARRADIGAVPGSGPILGIFGLAGEIYAVRANAGGTAGVLHKATASGWAVQDLGHSLYFDSGAVAEMVEGETITGGTSGATATVERVIATSGAWSGTAEGYLVISGITGTFSSGETITGGTSGGTATTLTPQAPNAIPATGKYRTVRHNFYGAAGTERIYGVSGQGYAFEWDGTIYVPILTGIGLSLDKPTHVAVHSNHLILGYRQGAILFSAIGNPVSFLSTGGAGELGFGETITGMKSQTKTATIITGQNRIGYLAGNDESDFELQLITEDSGAVPDSMEAIGQVYYLDNQGVRSIQTAESFGNWRFGTVSRMVEPFFRAQRRAGRTLIYAFRVRSKDQYRLLYDDGTGMMIYFGRNEPECMPFEVSFDPSCAVSIEGADGAELILAGDGAGMVYEIDAGTSADGEALESYARLSFLHQGAPNQVKRYHRALVDVESGGPETALSYSADYSYGDPNAAPGYEQTFAIRGGGGFWGSVTWDTFYWDSAAQGQARAELYGLGTNISMTFVTNAAHDEPHTLASVAINYTPRRALR